MSDSATFQIIYDGPALEANEMDVRYLAPALVAVADLLEETNYIVNGGGTKISVNVHGSFRSGSFGIDFRIIQDIYQNVMNFLTSGGVTAANNLITLLGLKGAKGLIELLKKLKNRKIQKVEDLDNNRVRIHITREETIDVDPRVVELYESPRVRDALEKMIAEPLGRSGVEEFRTKIKDDDSHVVVRKDEKDYFEMPLLGDDVLGESETIAYLQVVSLSFKEDNKWRFSRGEAIFYASVEDAKFLERINKNEVRFSKDDILKVRLYTKDMRTSIGFRTEYRVLEVLEHRSAAKQLRLPVEDNDDDGE